MIVVSSFARILLKNGGWTSRDRRCLAGFRQTRQAFDPFSQSIELRDSARGAAGAETLSIRLVWQRPPALRCVARQFGVPRPFEPLIEYDAASKFGNQRTAIAA